MSTATASPDSVTVLATRVHVAIDAIDHRLHPGSWLAVLRGLLGCVEWGPFSRPERWQDRDARGVTMAAIASKAHMSKRQAQRLIPVLEEMKLIEVRRRGGEGREHHFRLCVDRIFSLAERCREKTKRLISERREERRRERAEHLAEREEQGRQGAARAPALQDDPIFVALVELLTAKPELWSAGAVTLAGHLTGDHGYEGRRVAATVRKRHVAKLLPEALRCAQEQRAALEAGWAREAHALAQLDAQRLELEAETARAQARRARELDRQAEEDARAQLPALELRAAGTAGRLERQLSALEEHASAHLALEPQGAPHAPERRAWRAARLAHGEALRGLSSWLERLAGAPPPDEGARARLEALGALLEDAPPLSEQAAQLLD